MNLKIFKNLNRAKKTVFVISLASLVLYTVAYISCISIFMLATSGMDRADTEFTLLTTLIYVTCQLELFGIYLWLLYIWKNGSIKDRIDHRLILVLPIAIALISIPLVPYFSTDIFSYIAHGYVASQVKGNPYTQPLYQLRGTDIAARLAPMGWQPFHPESPYGGLWSWLEILSYKLGNTVFQSMVILKIIGLFSFLGTGLLVWRISKYLKLLDQFFPVIAFFWNPLLIQEFCFEAHNDGLMTFFTLLAVFFSLKNFLGRGLFVLLGGVLIKYLTLILIPSQIIHSWYKNKGIYISSQNFLLGTFSLISFIFLLYYPFWVGLETFTGGIKHFDHYLNSPLSLWQKIYTSIGMMLFCSFTLVQSWKSKTDGQFIHAFAIISCSFFFFVSPKFFPWYLILPVTLLFLSQQKYAFLTSIVLSAIGTFAIPANTMHASGFFVAYPTLAWIFSDDHSLATCAVFFTTIQAYPFLCKWLPQVVSFQVSEKSGQILKKSGLAKLTPFR